MKKECKKCKHHGIINDEERCMVKGITEFPSGYKMFNGCIRAYPIPKIRICNGFEKKDKSAQEDEE